VNETLALPFQLGVDRHNRVAQPEGPFYESLRNLILSDQNDLVRRKAMNLREVLMVSDSAGTAGGMAVYPNAGLPSGSSAPVQPRCLWFPPFRSGGNLGRPVVSVYRCADGTNLLMVDDVTRAVLMPSSRRRPQAVEWQGALWVATGGVIANAHSYFAGTGDSGIIRIGQYLDANNAWKIAIAAGMPLGLGQATAGHTPALEKFQQAKVIGTYADRVILANFPDDQYGQPRRAVMLFSDGPGDGFPTSVALPTEDVVGKGLDVPNFNALVGGNESDPLDDRSIFVGDVTEDIVGVKELSLQQSGAMNQSALLILKDRSIWIATGEPLVSTDVGDPIGTLNVIRQPLADGCASFETVCETPWGVIWAGHDDVYFAPNGGGAPVPIGRYIASEFKHTPFDLKHLWHASFHEGFYRLAIMAAGQNQSDPVAMENQWWLDLRYGPPQDWTKARWFGPQMYQPIIAPHCDETDIQRGTYVMAVEKRPEFESELFALQIGFYTAKLTNGGRYAFVLAGLDGLGVRDWTCEHSPNEWVRASETLDTTASSMSLRRAVVGGAFGQDGVGDTIWTHGRIKVPFSEMTLGAGTGGDPKWTDDTSNTDDGAATWADAGVIAVPSSDCNLAAHDGSDGAAAGTRGNAILAFLKTLELHGGVPALFKRLNLIDLVGSVNVSTRWDLRGRSNALEQSDTQRNINREGGHSLDLTALDSSTQSDIGLNDSDTAFKLVLDTAARFTTGRTVSFELSEVPGFVLADADLSFAFQVDVNGDGVPEVQVTATLTENYYADWGALLVAMCTAMDTAATAQGVSTGGTFTANQSTVVGYAKARLPRINNIGAGMERKWAPLIGSGDPDLQALGSVWRQLGFEQYWGATSGTNYTEITASYSPVARTVGNLRLAALEAKVRLFKRGPT